MVLYAKTGNDRYKIEINLFSTDNGFIAHLFGGEKSHVGAVLISIPRESLSGKNKISCTTTTLPLLGHKDDIVARALAEKIAKISEEPAVVISGIHIDNATAKDIEQLKQNVQKATQHILEKLKDKLNNQEKNSI